MDFVSHSFDALMAPLEASGLRERRESLLRRAAGRILEVGAGTGANLKHYHPETVREITITDVVLRPAIMQRGEGARTPIRFRQTGVEELPFPDEYFDVVVSTLVFCSVSDPMRGMEQVRRVLKPGGTFLFVEHILPSDGIARPLFNAVTPVWKRIAGGCHLNRETLSTIRDSGLHIDELQYFAGSTFAYGSATKPGTPEPAGAHGV